MAGWATASMLAPREATWQTGADANAGVGVEGRPFRGPVPGVVMWRWTRVDTAERRGGRSRSDELDIGEPLRSPLAEARRRSQNGPSRGGYRTTAEEKSQKRWWEETGVVCARRCRQGGGVCDSLVDRQRQQQQRHQ